MEPKLRYTAIEQGDINLIDAYSTDSELRRYNLTSINGRSRAIPSLSRSSSTQKGNIGGISGTGEDLKSTCRKNNR